MSALRRRVSAGCLAAGLCGLLCAPARAQNTTGAFLKIDVGAAPVGMGNAYTAIADDINSSQWNAAGLGWAQGRQFGATDAELYAQTRLDYAGYAQRLGGGTLSLSSVYLSQGAIDERGADRQALGTFTASDMALGVGYAHTVNQDLSLGLTAKLIQSQIANVTGTGWAADLGALYHTPMPGLSLGLAVQNLGPGIKFLSQTSNLPLAASFGAAYRLPVGLLLSADFKRDVYDQTNTVSMGMEYSALPFLSLRAGFLSGSGVVEGLNGGALEQAGGMGVGFGIKGRGVSLDYAFTPMGELGSAQRLSVGTKF